MANVVEVNCATGQATSRPETGPETQARQAREADYAAEQQAVAAKAADRAQAAADVKALARQGKAVDAVTLAKLMGIDLTP